MKALIRVTASLYEIGDIVTIVEDDHVFGDSGDIIPGHREVINIGVVTDAEKNLLLMSNSEFKNTSAVSKLPAFRHSLFNDYNLSHTKRRKYNLGATNKPELKNGN